MSRTTTFRCLSFLFVLFANIAMAQPVVKVLQSGKRVSFRGLSVVTDKVVWASGSSGTVVRSVNGGDTWEWMTVPGYEKRDFRDIEAFDANTAVIVGIAEPAVILKTNDGGKSWRKVFEDTAKGMFLDAMAFSDNRNGAVIGDPVKNNQAFEAYTTDQGETWQKRMYYAYPNAHTLEEGEAFFASSGTNLHMLTAEHFLMVSGGKASRLFYTGEKYPLPMMQGKESTGANSVAVFKNRKAVIVGGDFSKDAIDTGNCVLVNLETMAFSKPQTHPHGYRSCVVYLNKNKLIACGTSGVDISTDGGNNWALITKESFHVVQKAKKGKAVFLAGGGGKLGKLIPQK
jgi:photosystem II stability/assembly factor-like uncharacterized protein